MRKVTWRFWVVSAVLLAAYFMIGFNPGIQAKADNDIYTAGLTAVTAVAILFVAGYTVLGLTRDAHRWWKTDAGTALMIVVTGLLPAFGGLAWVFLFQGGVAKSGLLAWVILSGPVIEALALGWCFWTWLRALVRQRDQLRQSKTASEETR